MNNMLAFLSQVTVEAVVVPAKATSTPRTQRELQPKDGVADLRIWDNGAIYPSNALIAEHSLEYTAKEAADTSNGLDIIDTALMDAIKTPQRFVGVSVTARKEGKLDLFKATTYQEDGSPVSSVASQGTAMYGKETLLPLLKEVYNVVPNDEGYIDLKIVREFAIQSPNGIFQFPKTVTRGDKKGSFTLVRRENQTIFPLFPSEDSKFVDPEEVIEAKDENAVEVPAMTIPGAKTGEQVAQELKDKHAVAPVTPEEATPTPTPTVAEEPEYDTIKVGNMDVEVEKENNPLFIKLQEERAAKASEPESTDPFAPAEEEEEAEEIIITDAEQIAEDLENGAYDSEEEAEEVIDETPADPFADVPFTRPVAVAK